MKTERMYLNGKWVESLDRKTRIIINPANNLSMATVTEGAEADAQQAIQYARTAFDNGPWPQMRAPERASFLFKLADALEKKSEEFAILETENNGKPLRESRYDVADAAACFRYYAGLITKPLGQTFEVSDPNIQSMVVREPIGVCGQIIPWNYPLLMAAWKLAPGLAAGNCCILKPAETTPLTAIKLFELIDSLDFPPGSAQLLLGPGDPVGSLLASSPLVDKIAFTGGTVTGRKIMQAATGNLKKVTLELGGKSPNIIFADADLDIALEFAMFGILAGQGEVCSAGSRLLLESSIAKEFSSKLAKAFQKVVVGDGMDPETEMGPMISRAHLQKVLNYVQIGKDEGAKLLTGGKKIESDKLNVGNFMEPTIFAETTPEMKIVQEEIFGPFLVIQTFSNEEEAISLANHSIYGLAGGVFTKDGAKGMRVLRKLRAGITWMNTYHPTFVEAPWGGYKQSGIGRELGTFGLDAYTEVKQININLNPQRLGWFSKIGSYS
ncbi:MAG: aldehyde dehydrogenase family protein [Verrucomicrobiota bacterium]